MGLKEQLYLSEEQIFLGLKAADAHEALMIMAAKMHELDLVKDSYFPALWSREEVYPTGLDCGFIGVAIPHTDIIHVNRQSLAIALLDKPVSFIQMGGESTIAVSMIFLLAIKEERKQVELLSALMEIFMEEKNLKKLYEATSPVDLKEKFYALLDRKEVQE